MDKKYTAQEAARAVLAKASEMLKSSHLAKMEPTDDSTIAESEKDQTPPDGVQKQPTPEHDPHADKKNGNPPWGTEPGSYKLSRFMGHLDAKRKSRGAQNGQR